MRPVITLALIFSLACAHYGEDPHFWHTKRAAVEDESTSDFSEEELEAEAHEAVATSAAPAAAAASKSVTIGATDVRVSTAPPAPADAGYVTIVYPCPEAPPLQRLDGGYLMSDSRAARLACQLAACQEHRDVLRREIDDANPPLPPELPPSWQTWTMGLAIAVFSGAVFGVWIGLRIRD